MKGKREETAARSVMALKVVSYNLNRTDKAEALRAFLREIEDADVYCFQLISREVLGAVKEELGYAYADIFAGTGDGFGLASVTRLPVDPSIAKEHHEVEDREGGSPGTTFALTCVVRPPFGGSLAVTNAHLANTSEDARLRQIGELVGDGEGAAGDESLIVGDFNALCRSDYSDGEWDSLVSVAAERNWEPRREDAYQLMASNHLDACQSHGGSTGARELRTYDLDLGEDRPEGERVAALRLDYLFLSRKSRLRPTSFLVHRSIDVSNHFPIACSLTVQ